MRIHDVRQLPLDSSLVCVGRLERSRCSREVWIKIANCMLGAARLIENANNSRQSLHH